MAADGREDGDWPQMNADERRSERQGTTERIIGVFYEVYNELGPGFLESVYESSMTIALRAAGLEVTVQALVPVYFRGVLVGEFRADLVVDQSVLLELKAARAIEPAFEAQILNYLRATPIEIGLLLNFGPRPEVRRFAYSNARKRPPRPTDAQ